MMKTLFIIGNGFDCYGHNMNTQYIDFRNFLVNRYPEYNKAFGGILQETLMPDGDDVSHVRKTYSIQGSFGCKKQSIETLKVRKTTLEYLRQNGFKTVEDIIDKQLEIPSEYRGNIYAYLMFGIED